MNQNGAGALTLASVHEAFGQWLAFPTDEARPRYDLVDIGELGEQSAPASPLRRIRESQDALGYCPRFGSGEANHADPASAGRSGNRNNRR